MKIPRRLTIALDDDADSLLERIKEETGLSLSEIVRQAIFFYSENKELLDSYGRKKIEIYTSMLSKGEHIILDLDHWLLFLKCLESADNKEKFMESFKAVAKSHAEQFYRSKKSIDEYLDRLEACNFFTVDKTAEDEYTLILNSEVSKEFIKNLLLEVLTGMNYKVEIKEDFAKLRLKIIK